MEPAVEGVARLARDDGVVAVRVADEGTGKPEPGRDAGQQAKHGAEGSKSTGRASAWRGGTRSGKESERRG